MSPEQSRYTSRTAARAAEGWAVERLSPPSRLFGANGIRTGPDGRIYVAQVSGSQISAIDVDSGAMEVVSPMGGHVVAPDDIAFDPEGNLYVTEITEGRVSMLTPGGDYRVVHGDIPVANPITFHQGRLIAGECRMGGRIMELDRDGGAPRMLLEGVPMPNAFSVGPDGKLYFPVMAANEIWRIALDGGAPEVVARDLGVPDSVKFDPAGFIVSTQVASGQVLRIDPRNGDRTVLAQLSAGLDNCTFVGERLFVSNITGYVTEILADGRTRDLVPDGMNWPLGLAVDADGMVFVADGAFSYQIAPGGRRTLAGGLFSPGYPGYLRGIAASASGEFVVTTGTGEVARYRPALHESEVLARGLDQLFGIAAGEGGTIVCAEAGRGRVLSVGAGAVSVLASGLDTPKGVAIAADGVCYVAEAGGGRVLAVAGGKAATVVDGLVRPEGIVVCDGSLLIVDAGAKTVIAHDLASGRRTTIASGLPVGAPEGVVPKFIGPIGDMSGPMGSFAAIAAGADGTLYVSGDAEGSVLTLRRA